MPKTPDLKIESLAPAITEAERFLRWVMLEQGMDIPENAVTLTIQTRGKQARLCGWFSPDQWSTREGDSVHEITISAERLEGKVVEEILETLTHEAVHYWQADLPNENGVSKSGRHNKHFKERAEQVGLTVADPFDSRGFAYTEMGEALRQKIEDDFKPDYTAFNLFRLVKPRTSKVTKTTPYICRCDKGVTVRVANGKTFDATCNECGEGFEIKE